MSATLERGTLLHKRYRIIEILGQGGMGSVYRAVDENLGVDVAVKENLFTSDEYARQFRLEAVILANLRHPNLPRVTDHFVIGDQGQYLIMDYIEGEDLRQRMERSGSISEEEAILVGATMCDALQYLHTRKPSIIHRDVKPGNVRITPDGRIHLVDFGLAKLVKGNQATTTGARAMTPGYSPPEQYGTARTDPRTDVYSLGATLYAALTGIIPEDGLARAMDNVELTPLRKRNPKISRKLAAAIEKAMSIRPDDRFQSAEEFKQALITSNVKTQRMEGEMAVGATPPGGEIDENEDHTNEIPSDTSGTPISRPPSRPPAAKVRSPGWWIFFSFLLLVFLSIVLLIIFWPPISKRLSALTASSTPESGTPTVMVTNRPSSTVQLETTPSKTPLFFIPSFTSTITNTPTLTKTIAPTPTSFGGGNGQIAFASDRTGVPQIFLMNADGSSLTRVTNISAGACQPGWSPDGNYIVFISPCPGRQDQYPGAKLYIINADGSGKVELPSAEGGDFDPAWAPDGNRIAFTSLRDGSMQIYILNPAKNFSVTRLTEATPGDILKPDWSRQPAWSPSGTQILYTGHSLLTGTLQIWVMNDTGRDQAFLIHRGDAFWDFYPDWSPDGKTIIFSEKPDDLSRSRLMVWGYQSPLTAVTLRNGGFGMHDDYSQDGSWLVYEDELASRLDYDIYIIKSDGTGAIINLTDNPAMDFDPVWRPIIKP